MKGVFLLNEALKFGSFFCERAQVIAGSCVAAEVCGIGLEGCCAQLEREFNLAWKWWWAEAGPAEAMAVALS